MRNALHTLVLALGLTTLAPQAIALACSCMQQTPEQAEAAADAIFEARVLSVDAPPPPEQTEPVHVRVRVSQQWKGIESEEVELTTAANSAMCGYHFELEKVYLIYADRDEEGTLTVSLCSRTQLADVAAEDRTHLGPGITPVDPTVQDPGAPALGEESSEESSEGPATNGHAAQAGCASCRVGGPRTGALPLLVPGLLLGVALRRRRRRSRPDGAAGPL